MDHKLIIFAGACPGIGKSTLSSFLYKQLQLTGIKSRWFYEEDVSDELFFPGVVQAVETVGPQVREVLLESARLLVEGSLRSDEVFITDSLLPFFNWLFTINLDAAKIAAFSRNLEKALAPANPLMVYLDGNIAKAFRRALSHRGAKYETNFYGYTAQWTYFKARGIQPEKFEEIVDFFETENRLNLTLLAEWRCEKLILNTTSTGLDTLKGALLEKLGLEEKAVPAPPGPELLQKFEGGFNNTTGGNVPETLRITLKGPDLWVDTYWPDGTRLVALNASDFQLQDTSHYLLFNFSPESEITGLSYRIGNKEYSYVKRV